MRLISFVFAFMFVTPAMAIGPSKSYPCWVRLHSGAKAYMPDDAGNMEPVPGFSANTPEAIAGPLLSVDTKSPGAPWVWRLREYAYHRSDVDLYGDCTHVQVD